MPAATATSPTDHAAPAGTALQSGVSLSSPPSAPSPSSPPRSSDTSASSAFSSSSDAILTALADPDASLNSVARQFNISLATLTIWLARPDIQARVREMETGASTHTRLASSLNLSSAVRVLVRILDDFNALARSKPDPATHLSDPDYIRVSERARKAAYHLYRLSRIVPIDESILRRVHARSNTQTGSSRVPPLPSASSVALRVEDPSAPASPTNSPSASSVALRVEDPSSPASPTNTPSASSVALRVEDPSAPASPTNSPSAFTSHPIRPADLIRAASFSTPLRRATNPLLLALQTTDSG